MQPLPPFGSRRREIDRQTDQDRFVENSGALTRRVLPGGRTRRKRRDREQRSPVSRGLLPFPTPPSPASPLCFPSHHCSNPKTRALKSTGAAWQHRPDHVRPKRLVPLLGNEHPAISRRLLETTLLRHGPDPTRTLYTWRDSKLRAVYHLFEKRCRRGQAQIARTQLPRDCRLPSSRPNSAE